MQAHDTAAIAVFDFTGTFDRYFGATALNADQIHVIAMLVFKRQLHLAAIDFKVPALDGLPALLLRTQPHLLQSILHGRVIDIAGFVIDLQQHDYPTLS